MCCVPFLLPLFTWVIMSGDPTPLMVNSPFYTPLFARAHTQTHTQTLVCVYTESSPRYCNEVCSFFLFVSLAPYSGTFWLCDVYV